MSAADRAIRVSTTIVVVGIGTVAAGISYVHAYDVVTEHGETGATARLLPLTIDGMVYVASMVLLDSARRDRQAPGLAIATLALGIAATVAANVLHGIAHGVVGAIIAAWPAVTLVLVFELLMKMIRGSRAGEPKTAVAPESHVPDPVPAVPDPTTVAAELDAGSVLEVPAALPDPSPHQVRAASVFADEVAAGRVPSIRAIKAALRIGQPKAKEVHTYLVALSESR